ncbi:homoserine kinase type II [Paucibacter oligotrophus]|uniref:Homoserine kinase n=1 Tax=Roseateles oligotrophus TaxID=1769250 RepID=A0A840LBF6_9BURK|nr:homoserine kinase [Roseateles oligotrophus]MBB4845500.1 homoserine kinase type II [Roseateles oligotrophus]
MAVFTDVSTAQAQALVSRLQLGNLLSLRGIKAGIENTNYFLDTDRGEFVLTVFERLSFAQLPFYLQLMKHLAARGLAVPDPQADAEGEILFELQGKPCALVNKLRGGHQLAPDLFHCEQVGAELARMHLAGQDFPLQQPNLRGLAWWTETVPVLLPHLDAARAELLQSELAYQQQLAASAGYAELPRGPIHADLFRDNVMFEPVPPELSPGDSPPEGVPSTRERPVVDLGLPGRERLSGFFDFYFAGVDTWLFDLAVCLNDWCIDLASGRLDEARAQAFVQAYEGVRPLSGTEHRLLPALLRAAALRFWVSRLWDVHLPRDATLLTPHDPGHFERVLRERIQNPWHAMPEN